jgi:hypothetical protein
LFLGLALGFRGRLADHTAQVQQDYMLLASDLYFQGSPLTAVHDRLIKVGFPDPSLAVVGAADQLSSSPDKVKQQEADQLHQFAEALASGVDRNAPPAITIKPLSTTLPAPTTVALPTATVVAVAAAQAAAIPTDVAVAAPDTGAQAPAQPAATASAGVATAAATGAHTGIIRSTDQKPVFLRKDPSTKGKAVASMPYGATVTIKNTVQGTAVDAGNSKWYQVVYGGIPGYVYSSLVQVGG